MKKGLFLLVALLLLSGCWNNIEKKQKECMNYRSDYLEYIKEKYKLVDERDWYSEYYNQLDDWFTMFYSKVVDKCIAAFSYKEYGETWVRQLKINDVFADDELWSSYEAQVETDEERKTAITHFSLQKDYYRTWKDPYQFY